MIPFLRAFALAFLALTLAASSAHAQQQPDAAQARAFDQTAEGWRQALDAAQAALADPALSRAELAAVQAKVAAVHRAAVAASAEAATERKPIADQLAVLGAAPAAGQPPEPPDVARQRASLTAALQRYEAQAKQADLAVARADALALAIRRSDNERMARILLAREAPPLSRPVLAAAALQAGEVFDALAQAPLEWWGSSPLAQLASTNLGWIALVSVLVIAIGWPSRNWLLRRYGHRSDILDPSYARRVLAAVAEGLARGFLPAVGLLALVAALVGEEIVTGLLAQMVEGILVGIVFFSLTASLARAALAPEAPNWRIVRFGADASRTLARRLTALAAVAAAALGIRIATHMLQPEARELFNLLGFGLNTLIAAFSLALLERRLWRIEESAGEAAEDKPEPVRWTWPVLRFAIAMALFAVPILALLGYANFAGYIASRVVLMGVLVGALLLLRTLLRELLTLLLASAGAPSERTRRALALSEQGGRFLAFWAETALGLLLILLGIGLTLLLWGVPGSALGLWTGSALSGIEIGNMRISLADILLAILVFVAVWALTRLFQRLLDEKLLPQTRLDPGVRHSLSALVGYVGFVAAAVFAISALGLNLSNLALIAGALSVGIGFGLQNIVNNFVSGLILLIERPVKVGDWVVVGQHEGFVTRISVRATEIETFRRASVIIPNSELLSGAVINWTHRDKYGRVDVKVGIAYGSDTDKARELLLASAREHGQILSWPAPYVLFTEFGDSALQFELRGFIADVEQRFHVASDLLFAIDKAFRKAKIEMPFPQRDVHLRNVEELAKAIRDTGPDDSPAASRGVRSD
ncbi:MAG TPA: mechanosensitive ion channel domain-containing protein [Alphaproteobacteria bacterium]|nr:mechanosensitive ion channel domain-containing protein [Alphaproteobacteria bacterium]